MKKLKFQRNARKAIYEGLEQVYSAVASTLGPGGRNVLIEQRGRPPYITKDGATVAKSIELEDNFVNQGAQLLRAVSSKAALEVGDGTTTATILAYNLLKRGLPMVERGTSVVALERGILAAQAYLDKKIKNLATSTQLEHVSAIAKMSVNGDQDMADMVNKAFETGDAETSVVIEDNHLPRDDIQVVHGWQWNRGYVAQDFVNEPSKMRCVLHNPFVFVTNQEISSAGMIIPILQLAAGVDPSSQQPLPGEESRPILIIAKEVSGNALLTSIVNKEKGLVQVCVVQAPGYVATMDDLLQDIQAFTGGKFFNLDGINNIMKATRKDFGSAKQVIVEANRTSIIGGHGDKQQLADRLEKVRCLEKQALFDWERNNMRDRISKLKGRIVLLKVGATSEIEATEKKDRYEDAIYAVKAGLRSGFVPGGGVVSYALSKLPIPQLYEDESKDFRKGFQLLLDTLQAPIHVLLGNLDLKKSIKQIPTNLSASMKGYDLQDPDKGLIFLEEHGIIEPAEVLSSSIKQAVSMAITVLKTDTLVVFNDKD